jgi:UDP-N-acetylglucosamine/UDP-N-acetylgalactosamine diphosphorylase
MDWAGIEATLEQAGQLHVLKPTPPPERRAAFYAQLKSVDLSGLPQMLKTSLAGAEARTKKLEPFPNVVTLGDLPTSDVSALRARGLDMIARGEVAALLLAGGQGTRLGTAAPKGCYDIGLPSSKSLFQYHAERIVKVKEIAAKHAGIDLSAVRLRLLVMTSNATDAETRKFFAVHGYFGLGEEGVLFFEQGMLPCVTEEGKLMLDAPGDLAMAPNGNGGVYVSLRDSGILSALEHEGVTSVFQFGVDNVRVRRPALSSTSSPLLCVYSHVRHVTSLSLFTRARHADSVSCGGSDLPRLLREPRRRLRGQNGT